MPNTNFNEYILERATTAKGSCKIEKMKKVIFDGLNNAPDTFKIKLKERIYNKLKPNTIISPIQNFKYPVCLIYMNTFQEIAIEGIKKPVLEKDQIKFFLLQFRKLDITKEDDRQILIDNFINSIYLYDDRIIFIFNYKTEAQIVNLSDLECSDLGECGAPYSVTKKVVTQKKVCIYRL